MRSILSRLPPPPGASRDIPYSNKPKPMFTFLEGTTTEMHYTLFGCCDRFRYQQMGVQGYEYSSCIENMHLALKKASEAGVSEEGVSILQGSIESESAREKPTERQAISDERKPDPLNTFMHVLVVTGLRREEGGGKIECFPPQSRAGEDVVLGAECEVLAVMSACPNDVIPGVDGGNCVSVEYEVKGVGQIC
jgi:uncharacterized protein